MFILKEGGGGGGNGSCSVDSCGSGEKLETAIPLLLLLKKKREMNIEKDNGSTHGPQEESTTEVKCNVVWQHAAVRCGAVRCGVPTDALL